MNHWCSTNLNQTGFVLFSVSNQAAMRYFLTVKPSRFLRKIHICSFTCSFFFFFLFFNSTSIQGQVARVFILLWLRQVICLSYKTPTIVWRTGWRGAGHGYSCSFEKSVGDHELTKGLWATAPQLLTSAVNLPMELSPKLLLATSCF